MRQGSRDKQGECRPVSLPPVIRMLLEKIPRDGTDVNLERQGWIGDHQHNLDVSLM